MSNGFAFIPLFVIAGGYVFWQRALLKSIFEGNDFDPEWFQGIFRTGAIMTLAIVANAIPFLKTAGLEYEMALYEERAAPGGLLLSQLEVMAGTFALIAIIWGAVRAQGRESMGRARRGQMEVMAEVARRLMRPFWFAAFGIGSVFGVSAGFGLSDVFDHAVLLLGPQLLLAVELTIMWAMARSLPKYFD